jgi:hypothetical protein
MNDHSKNNKPNYHYNYNRSQAIEDGVLVDVTDTAKAIGIKWHVAVLLLYGEIILYGQITI